MEMVFDLCRKTEFWGSGNITYLVVARTRFLHGSPFPSDIVSARKEGVVSRGGDKNCVFQW
ncbi:MAG: hypothetical protein ACTTKL_04065 [Treponema sp.]